jgi:hypothetical protein
MKSIKPVAFGSCLLSVLVMFLSGCVIAPQREGYYDRDHHRYWHDHGWVNCGPDDPHCR